MVRILCDFYCIEQNTVVNKFSKNGCENPIIMQPFAIQNAASYRGFHEIS